MILDEKSFGNRLAGIGNQISNTVNRQLSNVKAQKEFTINNLKGLDSNELALLKKEIDALRTKESDKIKQSKAKGTQPSSATTKNYRYYDYVSKLINSYNKGMNKVSPNSTNNNTVNNTDNSNDNVLPKTWRIVKRMMPNTSQSDNAYYRLCTNLAQVNPSVNDNKLASFIYKYVATSKIPMTYLNPQGVAGQDWVWKNNSDNVVGAILSLAYQGDKFSRNQNLLVADSDTGETRYLTFNDIKGKDSNQIAKIFKDAFRLGNNTFATDTETDYADDKQLSRYNNYLDKMSRGNSVNVNKDVLSQLLASVPADVASTIFKYITNGTKNQ